MKNWRSLLGSFRAPLAGLVLALGVCTIVLIVFGESPTVLLEAFQNTLFTSFGLGYTLFYTTPLIFCGLSVAISFHCGLFNIGAEGQLYLGSIAIIVCAALFPGLHWIVAIPLAIVASIAAGGIWGGIAGWLKAHRGSHEVIVTILMNFVGMALVNYLILYQFQNPESQSPETFYVSESYFLPTLHTLFNGVGLNWLEHTPANLALLIAIGLAFLCHFFLFSTTPGFELRAVGQNDRASHFSGISVTKKVTLALFLSGALAGMVGVNEVMGYQHKVIDSFSPGYGFTAIAVALLARNNPIGIILSAFLFGTLQNSAREIEFLSEKVTKELSLIIQATLIAFVASDYLIGKYGKRIQKLLKRGKPA